jgi:hypothetical protein
MGVAFAQRYLRRASCFARSLSKVFQAWCCESAARSSRESKKQGERELEGNLLAAYTLRQRSLAYVLLTLSHVGIGKAFLNLTLY